MSTIIHHHFQGYHITFRDNRYHVQNDANPQDPYCDVTLEFPYLNTAKDYVRTLWQLMCDPLPEPANSMRLEPFYKYAHRPDGVLPTMFRVLQSHQPGTCAHVGCEVTMDGLAHMNVWRYCGRPVTRPGTTRCQVHEDYPERWQPPQPPLLDDPQVVTSHPTTLP